MEIEETLYTLLLVWVIYIIAFIVSLILFPGSISNLLYAFIVGNSIAILSIIMVLTSNDNAPRESKE